MDLVFYLMVMALVGLVNVVLGDRSGGTSPMVAESADISSKGLLVGNNLNGIYHKDAFLRIVKELGLL